MMAEIIQTTTQKGMGMEEVSFMMDFHTCWIELVKSDVLEMYKVKMQCTEQD